MAKSDTTAQLKKNIFWILSGLGVFLTLVTGILTLVLVGGAVAEKATANDKELSDIKAVQPKGTLAIKEMGEQDGVIAQAKQRLWEKNWLKQQSLFSWPHDRDGRLAKFEQKYQKFGEPMTEENAEFTMFKRPDVYEASYVTLAESVKPTQYLGSWRSVLRYVSEWGDRRPSAAQIWLALEDLWVQTAALKPVQAVNAAGTTFTPVGPANEPFKRAFQSRLWKVDLEVPTTGPEANKNFKVSLTNRTDRLQAFGEQSTLTLKVYLSDKANTAPVIVRLKRSYMKAGETFAFPSATTPIPPGTLVEKLAKVELLPDTKNVPVRRIDVVSLGKLDARHSSMALKPPPGGVFTELAAQAAALATPAAGGLGGVGEPMGSGSSSGGVGGRSVPGGPGGFGGATAGGTPESILNANLARYVEATEQVRRRPVAVVLVLDQIYLQDALAAYANSDLRFQVTQFHWERFRDPAETLGAPTNPNDPSGGLPGGYSGGYSGGYPGGSGGFQPGEGSEAGGPGGFGSGSSSGGRVPGFGGGMLSGGFGPGSGSDPGYGSAANAISDAQATSGLVKLSVYGIVTLYEKFEAKPGTETPAAE